MNRLYNRGLRLENEVKNGTDREDAEEKTMDSIS